MNQVTVTVGVKPSKNFNGLTFQASVTLDVPEHLTSDEVLLQAHAKALSFVDEESDKTLEALHNLVKEY